MKKYLATFLFILGVVNMTQGQSSDPKTDSTVKFEKATFGGGCFWCMEQPFDTLPGVKSVAAGYTGGHKENPTYEEVCTGTTGHAEAVEITFDPAKTKYEQLLDIFWRNIDPTAINQQFADRGTQYRTAIFYHSAEQKTKALASKEKIAKMGKFDKPIVTEISPASKFYIAEDYHQGYYKKCPLPYKAYRSGSGRAGYLEKMWGKDTSH